MTKLYDYTELSTLLSCEQEWSYRHQHGLVRPTVDVSPHFGQAVHAGVRALFNGAPKEVVTDAVTTSWGDFVAPEKKAHLNLAYAQAVVEMYGETYGLAGRQEESGARASLEPNHDRAECSEPASPFELVLNEHYLEWPERSLCGIVDRVMRSKQDGQLYVMDLKAQPLSSKVLTPNGWVTMGELKVGDKVIGSNGKGTLVIGIYPQGPREVYRVTFRDRSFCFCSEDHLWTVAPQNPSHSKWRTLPLKRLIGKKAYVQYRVPLISPVQFAEQTQALPLDPYLIGALLGDGYLGGNSIQFSTSEKEMVENVAAVLPYDTIIRKAGGKNYTYNLVGKDKKVSGNVVLWELRNLNLTITRSATKYVPEQYLRASIEQRLAVLQGLLDTDGCINNGSVCYDSTSIQLINNVLELVRSLGGTARYHKCTLGKWDKSPKWRVNIRLPDGVAPFRLQRKLAKINCKRKPLVRYITEIVPENRVEQMQCIKVAAEDGLYVTDNYIVTHNTTGLYLSQNWFEQWRHSLQAAIYLDLVEHYLANRAKEIGCSDVTAERAKPVAGFWVDAIHLDRRGYPKRDDFMRVGPFPYSQDLRIELRDVVEDLVARAQDLAVHPLAAHKNPRSCSRFNTLCSYFNLCTLDPADRADAVKLALASGDYKEERWEPSKRL